MKSFYKHFFYPFFCRYPKYFATNTIYVLNWVAMEDLLLEDENVDYDVIDVNMQDINTTVTEQPNRRSQSIATTIKNQPLPLVDRNFTNNNLMYIVMNLMKQLSWQSPQSASPSKKENRSTNLAYNCSPRKHARRRNKNYRNDKSNNISRESLFHDCDHQLSSCHHKPEYQRNSRQQTDKFYFDPKWTPVIIFVLAMVGIFVVSCILFESSMLKNKISLKDAFINKFSDKNRKCVADNKQKQYLIHGMQLKLVELETKLSYIDKQTTEVAAGERR